MANLRTADLKPIAIYCNIVSGYFVYVAGCVIFGKREGLVSSDFGLWFIEVLLFCLAAGAFAVGKGFLDLCQWAWKSLFFGFVVCISAVGPYLFTLVIIYYVNVKERAFYLQSFQTNSFEWILFLCFFVSEIIVLFYICKEKIVSRFGEMGDLITPT